MELEEGELLPDCFPSLDRQLPLSSFFCGKTGTEAYLFTYIVLYGTITDREVNYVSGWISDWSDP